MGFGGAFSPGDLRTISGSGRHKLQLEMIILQLIVF